MKRHTFGFVLLALWATETQAQESLLVGERLRATVLPVPSRSDLKTTVTGEYVGMGPTELRLSTGRPNGEQVREVDLDAILRLERARPRTIGERAGRGALFGAVAGAVLGAVVVAACASDEALVECGGSDYLVGSAVLGGLGAGAGALIGMAVPGTTWEEVGLPERR